MTEPTPRLRRAYATALSDYVADPREEPLQQAYVIGREALAHGVGLLELTSLHHDLLAAALREVKSLDEVDGVVRAACEFALEALSPYHTVGRGFEEAREAALAERQKAAMVRRLSSLLADLSLAGDGRRQYHELLRLVADHARELTGADACLVAVCNGPGVWSVDDDRDVAVEADALRGRTEGRSVPGVCLRPGSIAEPTPGSRHTPTPRATSTPAVGDWLAAPLTALDGTELGWIHVLTTPGRSFGDGDESVVLHIAELAAAALERTSFYESGRDGTTRSPRRATRPGS